MIVETKHAYHFYLEDNEYLGMLTYSGQLSDFTARIINNIGEFKKKTRAESILLKKCISNLLDAYIAEQTRHKIDHPKRFKEKYVKELQKRYSKSCELTDTEPASPLQRIKHLSMKKVQLRTLFHAFLLSRKKSLLSSHGYAEKMRACKDKHKGQRCFIIGNGPSLNKVDLNMLKDEFTFGVNGIFYKTDEVGFKPSFYVVEDNHVVADNLNRINSYNCPYNFFPHIYKNTIKPNNNTIFLPTDTGFYRQYHPFYSKPRFSKKCDEVIYTGQSVTYINMQLAYYMGFETVYLIGMDFSYSLPKSTIINGINYTSQEDDPNHFHQDYFGKGKKWHDPKLDRVAMCYEYAKQIYEESGWKIYNATIGGKLEIFERVNFLDLFK